MSRREQIRQAMAWRDCKLENFGTDLGQRAAREERLILEGLGELTPDEQGFAASYYAWLRSCGGKS